MEQSKAELLSLQQLRCFCAALDLGSFTAAAQALRVSQPAVAEQIRRLEHALGTDLFVRRGHGVVATEAGRAFAEHAARSLRAVEDAAGSVGELTGLRGGTVAVGIFSGPAAWRVDELVVAFLRRHPDVSVRLVGRNSSARATTIRSAASSPSGRRRWASRCGRRSRWSSRTSRCGSSPPASATRTSRAPTATSYYPPGLTTTSFSPALYDTVAIITRPGARLSPGVRELLTDLEAHLRAVADELDRALRKRHRMPRR